MWPMLRAMQRATLWAVLWSPALGSPLGSPQWDPHPAQIPQYVLDNAPLVSLYSEEKYMPGDIAQYVQHFWVSNSSTNSTQPVTIERLNAIARAAFGDEDLFLSARHEWKDSRWIQNLGDDPQPWDGKIADSPATLIVVDKGAFVDAFWFYFYPFNEGPYVMGGGPMGNHLGDWEHSLVRFVDGEPQLLWMSAHGGGTAYQWGAVPKDGGRPVLYSARGTHANYVARGQHSHDIPWHWLSDFTDRGYLWDPVQNHLAYTFDGHTVRPANGSRAGRELDYGDWLLFDGHWGDPQLPSSDWRQHWALFGWQMIDGPRGPLAKTLMRTKPCERHKWWNVFAMCRLRTRPEQAEGIEAADYGGWPLAWLPPRWRYPVHALFLNSWARYAANLVWG